MKILILTSRFPYPVEKGDKLRIFHQLKVLAQGHEIVLCSLSEETVKQEHLNIVKEYCSRVYVYQQSKLKVGLNLIRGFFSNLPLQVSYFYNPGIKAKIQKVIAEEKPGHIFCQLIRMAEYAKGSPFPKTLDYMDTFSVGAARWAEHASFFLKPILKREAKKLKDYERNIFETFDHHTIISSQDRDLLDIKEKAKIHIIANGVDTQFFQADPSFEKIHDLVFVGNMGYKPNVEAAKYLGTEILPLLYKKAPKIKTLIAGARPTNEIVKLANEQLKVSGWLDDIRDGYNSASIMVAPLFLGSGLQNKILEGMAMGLPCITTSLVNNAINAVDGESILIADTKEAFVEKIISLQENPALYSKISKNGLTFVIENFSWDSFVKDLETIIINQ